MLTVLLADLHLGLFGRLSWWVLVPLIVYWAIVVVLLIYDNREPSSTLIWLFVLVFLPVVGLVFFLFFGRDWKVITARRHWAEGYVAAVKAKMRPIYERNAATQARFDELYADTPAADISTTIRVDSDSWPLPADSVEIFATGAEKFTRLERDLAAADARSSTWSTSSGSRTSSRRASPRSCSSASRPASRCAYSTTTSAASASRRTSSRSWRRPAPR